jgi:hypothetical protein
MHNRIAVLTEGKTEEEAFEKAEEFVRDTLVQEPYGFDYYQTLKESGRYDDELKEYPSVIKYDSYIGKKLLLEMNIADHKRQDMWLGMAEEYKAKNDHAEYCNYLNIATSHSQHSIFCPDFSSMPIYDLISPFPKQYLKENYENLYICGFDVHF